MKPIAVIARISTSLALGLAAAAAGAGPQMAARVEINATEYPHAKCNDGTQATYYVRGAAADGSISGRKWLIFLHGGGSCKNDDECAERWYDRTGGPDGLIGFHGNMTASADPTHDFNGQGVLDFDGVDAQGGAGVNPFAGFNRVMVPYCSSDTYSGRNTTARAVDYTSYVGRTLTINGTQVSITNPGNLIPPLTSIRFSGRIIVESVADLLMKGGIRNGRRTEPDAQGYVAPPSAAADEVVITGSSAGGFGVIRNLDNMARIVQGAASAVKVFGVIDAADVVGVLPESSITGDPDYETAAFYRATAEDEVDTTCLRVYPLASSHKCFNGVVVLRRFIETPHFVAQQAYDGVIHGGLVQTIATQLAAYVPATTAESLAVQYVRNRISNGARDLGGGVANAQHVGWFIPNYALAHHQLLAEDIWFFNSPLGFAAFGGNDPRLGGDPRSTLGLPRALACFRFKVSGQGSGCVDAGDAKVINTTYPTDPLTASFDPRSSTLTLPYVRASNGSTYQNVAVVLGPLGTAVVNDPTVSDLGGLPTYDIATNVLRLPLVSVDGVIYERVSLTGPGIRVLSGEPAVF